MLTVEENLAKSLTAESVELIPYLSYLLQDLWDLGSLPEDMVELANEHMSVSRSFKVLDLACGKGAVSVHLAKALGVSVTGIDIMADFIVYAKEKAAEYNVASLCDFIVDDINKRVMTEKGYDLVILGAVGDVLGTPEETITKLKQTIRPEGYILIDDGYGKVGIETDYYTRQDWLDVFKKTQVRLIAEKTITDDAMAAINREQQIHIVKRAHELMVKYPDKAGLFEGYIRSQQAECDELEQEITGVTLLLQKIAE